MIVLVRAVAAQRVCSAPVSLHVIPLVHCCAFVSIAVCPTMSSNTVLLSASQLQRCPAATPPFFAPRAPADTLDDILQSMPGILCRKLHCIARNGVYELP